MIKTWWGICWRMLAMWVVFAIPSGIIYSLIFNTVDTIKIKPTVSYGFLALLMFVIARLPKLNQFIWNRILGSGSVNIVANSIAMLYLFSAVLNLLVAIFASTEMWVDTKISLGVFMFFISPFIVAFIANFKNQNQIAALKK